MTTYLVAQSELPQPSSERQPIDMGRLSQSRGNAAQVIVANAHGITSSGWAS